MKKAIYLSILTVATVGCILVGCFRKFSWLGFRWGSSSTTEGTETELDTFTTIQMDIAAAEVILKTGSGFSIAYSGPDERQPSYTIENDVLNVRDGREKTIFHTNGNSKITITVPDVTTLQDLGAQIDAGSLEIYDVNAASFDANVDAGNVEVYNGSYTDVSIEVDVGNVTFDSCIVTKVNADSDMGNIEFKACAFDVIEAAVDMGNIEINSSRSLDDYKICLETELGGITVNNHSYTGGYYKNGDSDHRVDISVDLGNATLTY